MADEKIEEITELYATAKDEVSFPQAVDGGTNGMDD